MRFSALNAEGLEAMSAAARLLEYRQYLAQARAFKARSQHPDGGIDREVLANGRQAAADARTLSLGALRMLRHLERGGAVERLQHGWTRAARASGPVSCADEWSRAMGAPGAREAVIGAGIPESVLNAIDETIRAVDLEVSTRGRQLTVTGTVDGARVQGLLDLPDPARKPTTVTELLTRGRFDQAIETLEGGEPFPVGDVATIESAHLELRDVLLVGALDVRREAVRHVRKLEDTGLATYQGGEPTTVATVLGIALAAWIAGAILMGVYCAKFTDATTITGEDSAGCVIGKLLFWLALILTLGVIAKGKGSSTGPTNLALEGPLIHGIVKDMELSRA